MSETVPPDSEQSLEAPPRLVAALKAGAERTVFVPPAVDRAILEAGRAQLNPEKKAALSGWRRWAFWPALVGACAIVALIVRVLMPPAHFAREDLNHDGKVDILDSFALARELKTGRALPAKFDVNGDGVIDERDVTSIAAHAVALGKDDRS
jgi:hypothetical protein